MKVSAVLLLVLISGCSAQYTRNTVGQALVDSGLAKHAEVHRSGSWVLARDTRLALVPLHINDYQDYPRTVHRINETLIATFQKHFFYTQAVESFDASLAASKNDIIVVTRLGEHKNNLSSKIELFEGRALHEGEKIGRDVIRLELSLFDARSGKLLDTLSVLARSAFFSDADQTPIALIRVALEEAAAQLAAVPNA